MGLIDNVELVIKQVRCIKNTRKEPGETDEIYFAVTGGPNITREDEFDIREGETVVRDKMLWSHPVQDGGELLFSLHLRETDFFINPGGNEPTQNLGDAQIRVTKRGEDVIANCNPAGSLMAGVIAENTLGYSGAGASYHVAVDIVVTSNGSKRSIPLT